jgi:hypothetical protein
MHVFWLLPPMGVGPQRRGQALCDPSRIGQYGNEAKKIGGVKIEYVFLYGISSFFVLVHSSRLIKVGLGVSVVAYIVA